MPSSEISEEAEQELADIAATGEDAGLQVEFSGGIAAEEAEHGSESLGMIVAFFVLAITLASLLAAGMPLLTAALGVVIGITGLTALSGVIDLSETAPILATMLGLAVGIDYALFILARHKQNLGDGMERARVRRPGDRHRRQRRRLRRHDRRHRARRPVRHQHPVPVGHGPGRRRHRRRSPC